MEMDVEIFYERLISALGNLKDKYELENIHDALIFWFAENYIRLEPDEILDRIVKDYHTEGIDSVLLDSTNFDVYFIQAKIVEKFHKTKNHLSEKIIKDTLAGTEYLFTGDYKGKITPDLENLVDEFHDLDKTGNYKTKIAFLTLNKKNQSKFISDFQKKFPDVKIEFYDFDWFYNFYIKVYLESVSAPPDKIIFKIESNIMYKEKPFQAKIFTIKAEELAKIFSVHKAKTIQQNVRGFLGLRKGSINRSIYKTATDSTDCHFFWYYNNGITIVCSKIISTKSGKTITLKKAQIINGAQTTYALYKALEEGLLQDDTEILIKVIETNNQDVLENITLYTNSQNAIRLRDLCSNDEIQIKIQKMLLGSYGYFYERKRGELDTKYPTPLAKENFLGDKYKNRIISNENAAQALLALYLDKSSQAKSQKARIFVKGDTGFYSDIFDSQDLILEEKILLSWKLLKFLENKKKVYKKEYKNTVNLSKKEKKKIFDLDFILHSEYFILNLFRDFLLNESKDIIKNKNDILEVIKAIDTEDELIVKIYNRIVDTLKDCILILKKQQGYYHNKFFKNDRSIGVLRNMINKTYSFVEII